VSRIRHIEIKHFRCIESFTWVPKPGLNCLIGPGDTGKSSVLDALDKCVGGRKHIPCSDADFYRHDVSSPICISVTLGDLDDSLKNLELYGLYLRGSNKDNGQVLPEPEAGNETVLTIRLTITGDLEPTWSLYSERAEAQGQSRYLTWADRTKLAAVRLGQSAGYNLTWGKGSILNRVSTRANTRRHLRSSAAAEAAESCGFKTG
jgi:putative ATP-dependent endonuclease of the OLD family